MYWSIIKGYIMPLIFSSKILGGLLLQLLVTQHLHFSILWHHLQGSQKSNEFSHAWTIHTDVSLMQDKRTFLSTSHVFLEESVLDTSIVLVMSDLISCRKRYEFDICFSFLFNPVSRAFVFCIFRGRKEPQAFSLHHQHWSFRTKKTIRKSGRIQSNLKGEKESE